MMQPAYGYDYPGHGDLARWSLGMLHWARTSEIRLEILT